MPQWLKKKRRGEVMKKGGRSKQQHQEPDCGFVGGDALLSPPARPISMSRSACGGGGGGVAPPQPSSRRRAAILPASTTTATPAIGPGAGCGACSTGGCCCGGGGAAPPVLTASWEPKKSTLVGKLGDSGSASGGCTAGASSTIGHRHSGQVECDRSHMSTHSTWNPWPHRGSRRAASPAASSVMQTAQSAEAKVRLKSDNANAGSFKKRISTILDQKLKKLQGRESSYEDVKPSDQNLDDHTKPVKLTIKQQMARTAKMNELLGKLTRAESEDDLKPCLDIMAQLFGKENGSSMGTSNKSSGNELLSSDQESTAAVAPSYSFPKLWTRMEVHVDMMSKINDEFSSSSQVVQL